MEITVLLCGLAVGVLLCSWLAERVDVPAPFILILVGIAASYLPHLPEVELTSDVVLFGLLPPLLYAAAHNTSLVDFKANKRPILLLSVGLVVFTTLGVGLTTHWLLPGVTWAIAFAIGAVVAPPDAVAATAIGRTIGLPRRIVTILEGESLLNDATALVALGTALSVAEGDGFHADHVALDFLLAAGGGVLIGYVFYRVVRPLRMLLRDDPVFDTSLSFVVPFAAFVVGEELHASGVLAVVVAGLLLGHDSAEIQSARSRVAERLNWRTVAFLLENAVFLLIGLQFRGLLADALDGDLANGRIALLCAVVVVTVIVLRLVWVFPARYLIVRTAAVVDGHKPPWTFTFILGWAGMRGVVTLAAAFIIPVGTPRREVLLIMAFAVVAGTLFVQGLTLPILARRLRVPGPDPAEDALARATLMQQAGKAALHRLDELEYDPANQQAVDMIRARVDYRNYAAWERLGTNSERESPSDTYARLRLDMLGSERHKVLKIRDSGRVASEVVEDVLAALDLEESMIDVASEERREVREAVDVRRRSGFGCDDLLDYPAVETVDGPICQRCLDEDLAWVALRQCLECGNVACCDSSVGQHATAHFQDTTHPVMESAEPGEDWRWCYVHHTTG